MLTPQKLGKNVRMSFSRVGEAIEMPNLLEVQKKSFEWFLRDGLREVLDDVSPIVDYSGNLVLLHFTPCPLRFGRFALCRRTLFCLGF